MTTWNWTPEVIISIIALSILIFTGGSILRHYQKHKYAHALYLGMFWVVGALWCLFSMLSFLFLSIFLRKIGIIIVSFTVFFGVLLVDSVSSDSIDWKKMGLFFILITATLITACDPKSVSVEVYSTGHQTVMTNGAFKYVSILPPGLSGILMMVYFYKIHLNAPSKLKNYSQLLVIGSSIGLMMAVAIGLKINDKIPALLQILISISSILITHALIKEPRLAFILPFKAGKINVITMDSGMPIFNYIWNPNLKGELSTDALFSGLIQGINIFASQTIKGGNIHEIILDNATIMLTIHPESSTVCVLTVNRSTRALRNALTHFSKDFFRTYQDKMEVTFDIEMFTSATSLIEKHFPFVPKYE